jgi:hypothetical protein
MRRDLGVEHDRIDSGSTSQYSELLIINNENK